jgi:hypothetical protein
MRDYAESHGHGGKLVHWHRTLFLFLGDSLGFLADGFVLKLHCFEEEPDFAEGPCNGSAPFGRLQARRPAGATSRPLVAAASGWGKAAIANLRARPPSRAQPRHCHGTRAARSQAASGSPGRRCSLELTGRGVRSCQPPPGGLCQNRITDQAGPGRAGPVAHWLASLRPAGPGLLNIASGGVGHSGI